MLQILLDNAATSQPSWDQGIINILTWLWGAIGGTAGVIALLLALKNAGLIGKVKDVVVAQGKQQENQRLKINEVADKNEADVLPLPPCPIPTLDPAPPAPPLVAAKVP